MMLFDGNVREMEDFPCKCGNEAVEISASILLLIGHSPSSISLENGSTGQRRRNTFTRIISEISTISFPQLPTRGMKLSEYARK